MNALPVGGERLKDAEFRKRYFEDLERQGFDVAYTAYYAYTHEQVTKDYRDGYIALARDAHERGYPACVQIQSTLCNPKVLDLAEAQYHIDNTPDAREDGCFFASFASQKWEECLKELTRIFVEDYGYDWVVYEEPMYRVDIPGTKDKFHEVFLERYPGVAYPTKRAETTSYLKVQRLKADLLVEFYDKLTSHAKSVGAKKTGVMPWFFIPTIENTPAGTLNTSCDIGRIGALNNLDFLVVRMQPDNIHADVMRTGDGAQQSASLYYPEVMAHGLGKPIMAVSNPVDEHTNFPEIPLIPLEFFKRSLLASLAAAPNGMTRHWYGQRYGEDTDHMNFMAQVNSYVSRLGNPVSPVGFLFSYRGGRHAEPHTYETVWPFYWSIVKQLMFDEKLPVHTLYAETLAQNLESSPELRVIILEEHFPLTIGEARVLKQWWQARPGRAVLVFGSGLGFCADPEQPGARPMNQSFAEILQTLGVSLRPQSQVETVGGIVDMVYVSKVRRTAFLGESMEVATDSIANLERVFGSRSVALYTDQHTGTPVIISYGAGDLFGMVCGLGSSASTAPVAAKLIRHTLERMHVDEPVVRSNSPELLWNLTRTEYVVVTNPSDAPASAELMHNNFLMWDVVRKSMQPNQKSSSLTLEPFGFSVFRRIGKRAKLYDVDGALYLKSIIDGAGRADISALTGTGLSVMVKNPPVEVKVDGRNAQYTTLPCAEHSEIVLTGLTSGEHLITLTW